MDFFSLKPAANATTPELHCEQITAAAIARRFGTPAYVYSRAALAANFLAYQQALDGIDHQICYAVKANSNIAVLNVLARLGAGFDIVSGGELERVLAAGGDPARVVFSGVAKTRAEMQRALAVGIGCFNVESAAELVRLNEVAAGVGKVAPISLRVNPDVDANTHPYISTGLKQNKFGIAIEDAAGLYRQAATTLKNLKVIGVDCHIGSQLTQIAPFLDALDRVLALVDELAAAGIHIEHLDLGGGLGVRYRDETPPTPADYIGAVRKRLGDRKLKLAFEPGRSIVANAGILLTQVEYLKSTAEKDFAIVDAAMNDLLRPALYSAWMRIEAAVPRPDVAVKSYDIVGPVCETGDFLGKDRELALAEGDLLAVFGAGAYGFSMSSNYNTRGRACELMVDGSDVYVIRARETVADQLRGESLVP
jgi:diaminopimelate decarboxylase